MTQTEKTTKDINTGGLDVSLTLDHTLLRGDFDKLGKDVTKTIATGAFIGRNTAYVIGAGNNDYSGKGASKEIKGSNIFERIWEVSSGAQESQTEQSLAKLDTNMQGAVDIINNMQSHTTEELEGALELLQGVDIYMYADLNAKAKAFITHREEGEPEKINLNLGTVDILTPEKTIFTTKHEGYHLDLNLTAEEYHADEAHQESLANAKGFGAASGWELYNVLNNNEVGERSENDLTIWRTQNLGTKNLGTKNIIKNTKEVAKIPMNERQNELIRLLANTETGHVAVGGTTFQGYAVFDQNGISINPETGMPRSVFLINPNTGEKFPVLTITELMRVDDILESNRWNQSVLQGLQVASDYYSLKSAGNAAVNSLARGENIAMTTGVSYIQYLLPSHSVSVINLSLGAASTSFSTEDSRNEFYSDTLIPGYGTVTQGYENIKAWTGSRIQYGYDLNVDSLASFEVRYSNEAWKLDISEENKFLQNDMNPYQLKLMELYLER